MSKKNGREYVLSQQNLWLFEHSQHIVLDDYCDTGVIRNFVSEDETKRFVARCTSWWGYRSENHGGCYSSSFKLIEE